MKVRRTALMAALCLTAAGSALAQQGNRPATESVRPPTPRKSDDPPILWNFLALVVMGGAIFAANMIPSKRGHQD